MDGTWRVRTGAALLALLSLAAAGGGPARASQDRLLPDGAGSSRCGTPSAAPDASAGQARAAPGAWYRLVDRSDRRGWLTGWRLEGGALGAAASVARELPVEAHAAGPFGSAVLVSADDGRRSRVETVDITTGCSNVVLESEHVVRRATLAPGGHAVFYFMVDRATRRDLGVWHRSLWTGETRRSVPPLPRTDATARRIGPIFSTELVWSSDGRFLAVDSCGAADCRTRLLEPASGLVRSFTGAETGELVGVTRSELLHYAACPGLPCPVVATRIGDGARRQLVASAGSVRLVAAPDGERLAYDPSAAGRDIAVLALAKGAARKLHRLADGEALLPGPARALAGATMPAGQVPLVPASGAADRIPVASLDLTADAASAREVLR